MLGKGRGLGRRIGETSLVGGGESVFSLFTGKVPRLAVAVETAMGTTLVSTPLAPDDRVST